MSVTLRYEIDNYINLDSLKRLLQGQGDEFREYSDSDYLKLIQDHDTGKISRKGQLSLSGTDAVIFLKFDYIRVSNFLGFATMLLSSSFDARHSSHRQRCQDMSQSLCNYFIASSHNTYKFHCEHVCVVLLAHKDF